MAVSGRKQTDLLCPIAAGSAGDFDNKCEPCLTVGQHEEAHGFCVQCQEYLCKTCYDCHRKTKLSRSHQILKQDEFDKAHSTKQQYHECTEKCPFHQKRIIKFYCPTHAKLGCTDCMHISHRYCKIDYIPEKCADLANGNEYDDIMMELGKKLKEAEDLSLRAVGSRRDINESNKEIIKEIEDFREEINERLDQMQHDVLNNVRSKKSSNVKIVKKVIATCKKIICDVTKLQTSLRANKSNNQNGQLYIDIKRAEYALKLDELKEANEKLLNMNIHYSFRRGADVANVLSKEIIFGEINSDARTDSTITKSIIERLTLKDINIKTKSDEQKCFITGCAVQTSNKLVLADLNNNKVKVVSAENKRVQEEMIIDSEPFDIAVISQDQFAVTVPDKRRIDVIKADDKLSCVRSINVNGKCCGIDCHQDRLHVLCLEPSSVVVLTTQGKVLDNIPLNFLSSKYFTYIAVRKDSNFLYISDYITNSVVSVSLQGDILAIYKHEDLREPMGMCLLDDGSLLVCSSNNGTIHQIQSDLKEGKIAYKDRVYPYSICYSSQDGEVYVGCLGDQLKVQSTK